MAAGLFIASRRMGRRSFSTVRPRKKLSRWPSMPPAISTRPLPERSVAERRLWEWASPSPHQHRIRPLPAGISALLPLPSPPRRLPALPAPGAGATGGSEIYRIAPDGAPSRLWTSHEDLVYALAFDQRGRLLAGTGNRGHIFAINGVDDFTDLIKASATQITAFAAAPGGGLYASSSNLGKIFVLGPGP